MSGNQLAKRTENTLSAIINSDSMKKQWALVLPKCLTPDRLARVALTQLRKNPKLGKCTQESFLGAMMKCAELGLEPNGRDAHLVPYGAECTMIPDYKGLVRLVRRDADVKDVQVFTVRENDTFKWTPDGIEHTFGLRSPRGEVIGCYTKISWMNGTTSYGEPMTRDEAETIRNASPSGKSGPWVTWFTEMWKKSAIKRDSKMWPLSPETQDAIAAADEGVELNAGGISIESPIAGMKPADEVVEEPVPMFSAEEQEPESQETEESPEGLTPVEKLNKPACVAEIKLHEGAVYYAGVLDELNLPPNVEMKDCPVDLLRDIVSEMRRQQEGMGA